MLVSLNILSIRLGHAGIIEHSVWFSDTRFLFFYFKEWTEKEKKKKKKKKNNYI